MIKHVMDFTYEDIMNARTKFTEHDPEASLSERLEAIKKAWDEVLPLYIKHHKEKAHGEYDFYAINYDMRAKHDH